MIFKKCLLLLLWPFIWSCKSNEIPFDPPKVAKKQIFFRNLQVSQKFNDTNVNVIFSYAPESIPWAMIDEVGFYYSTTSTQPKLKDRKVSTTGYFTATGTFEKQKLAIFSPDSIYYLNPFAVLDGVTYYGSDVSGGTKSFASRRCDAPVVSGSANRLVDIKVIGNVLCFFEQNDKLNLVNSIGMIYQYDASTNAWQITSRSLFDNNAEPTLAFGSMYAFTIKDKIYAGFGTQSSNYTNSGQVFELDTKANEWRKLPVVGLVPDTRLTYFAVTDSSCIFLKIQDRNSLWEYIPGQKVIKPFGKIDPNDQIYSQSLLQLKQQVFMIGRYATGGGNYIFSFDLNTRKYQQLQTLENPPCFDELVDYFPEGWGQSTKIYFKISSFDTYYGRVNNPPIRQYNVLNNTWESSIEIQEIDALSRFSSIYSIGQKTFSYDQNTGKFWEIILPK